MRFVSCLNSLFVFLLLAGSATLAHAQHSLDGALASAATQAPMSNPMASATASMAPTSVLIQGKVMCPEGTLPGAVIKLRSTQQMAVANANGEFRLLVPSGSGAQAATISFAGYADEEVLLPATSGSSVELSTVQIIKVKRNQRLATYMKTARKQARRDLRKVRKA